MNIRLFTGRRQHRHTKPQAELARLRTENTDLRRELGELNGRYMKALETIDQSVGDRAELAQRLGTATQRMSEAELVVKCLSAENERLNAALKSPVVRVIPLQQRGPDAA